MNDPRIAVLVAAALLASACRSEAPPQEREKPAELQTRQFSAQQMQLLNLQPEHILSTSSSGAVVKTNAGRKGDVVDVGFHLPDGPLRARARVEGDGTTLTFVEIDPASRARWSAFRERIGR